MEGITTVKHNSMQKSSNIHSIAVFRSKNGSKTEFHRNGLLAKIGSNLQEGQN